MRLISSKNVKLLLVALVIITMVAGTLDVSTAAVKNKTYTKPYITSLSTTATSVKVSWKATSGAKSYMVYRKTGKSKYKSIAKVKKSLKAYTDKKVVTGKKYYYKIRAVKTGRDVYGTAYSITPANLEAPTIVSVSQYQSGSGDRANLTWKSVAGYTYKVYKKVPGGSYTYAGSKTATSDVTTFNDKNLSRDTVYTFTVRRVKDKGITHKYGSYDAEGVTTITAKPAVTADMNNLNASVTWTGVDGIDGYMLYRGINDTSYSYLGTYNAGTLSYKETYHDAMSAADRAEYLVSDYYLDSSVSAVSYRVRAYKVTNGKTSYGSYYPLGGFHLEAPDIVNATLSGSNQVTIEWSNVKHAEEYYIYDGYKDASGMHWSFIGKANQRNSTRQSATFTTDPTHTYYTVKARSTLNGNTVYSDYDTGYTIANRKYSNENVLFLGDSITFGSPYKGKTTKDVFSYPWRVNQITGANYYNPSIPGATLADRDTPQDSYHRYRIVVDVAQKIKNGYQPYAPTGLFTNPDNNQTFKDFSVVVIAAGTNDYADDIVIGDETSTDISTYRGAMNQIMEYIAEGSAQRVKAGLPATKVVFADLYYSNRYTDYSQLTNRFVNKNKLGNTLTDYQNAMTASKKYYENTKYKDSGMKFYEFDTSSFVTSSNCPMVTSDNLHMTRYTYGQIGNAMGNYLIDNVFQK